MMENVNILMGRFQPITMGHIKCAEETWRKKKTPTLLLIVDTTKEDDKHPFTTSTLLPYYEKLSKEFKFITGYVIVKNADIVKNTTICKDAGFNPISWTCGSDRYEAYKKMAEKYGGQAGLTPDFEVIEIKRGEGDVSATKVRNSILRNDVIEFEKLTPKSIHQAYPILKEKVEKYCTLKEHVGGLYRYIMERMGDLAITKMFAKYPAYISAHIIKQGPKINRIMGEVEDCYADTCITGNKLYWFFADTEVCEDVWGKFQRILSSKPIKTLVGEQTLTDDNIELTMVIN